MTPLTAMIPAPHPPLGDPGSPRAQGGAREGSRVQGRELRIEGAVQGVGFRPHLHRLAVEECISGDACNTPDGVVVCAWASSERLDRFARRIRDEAPPLARVDAIVMRPLSAEAPIGFRIASSRTGSARLSAVVPDAAICEDCRRELFDPADRRYRYPFISCAHCGPRLSIVTGLPYDRARTTMAAFPMCPACAGEYADPSDRRFHAQPIACPECGPRAWLEEGEARLDGDAAIGRAVRIVRDGGILALRGLGGFHLACRALDPDAVARLRERKRRPVKPFALMVRDESVARRFGAFDRAALAVFASPAAPIVLVPSKGTIPNVAPGLDRIGIMRAATPLHALLLEEFDEPLVMTSGNRHGEPQATGCEDARERLGEIADAFLMHDRAIACRLDDSVVRSKRGEVRTLRRARGMAPRPLRLPEGFERAPRILAMGGDGKAAVAVLADGEVRPGPHLGDVAHPLGLAALHDAAEAETSPLPATVAVDPHPAYRSTALGREIGRAHAIHVERVGHHHAHAAAALLEHGVSLDAPPHLVLALDGLGVDEGGELRGCELMECDYRRARRLGGLLAAPLLGGDRAAREPWRNLVARLHRAFGEPAAWPQPLRDRLRARPLGPAIAALNAGMTGAPASSAGRLFDAVAAALGICDHGQSYEGEAAMRLETMARGARQRAPGVRDVEPYAFDLVPDLTLDPAPLWPGIADDLAAGKEPARMALRFHLGLADALSALVRGAGRSGDVVLTGGTFQNELLGELVRDRLHTDGHGTIEHAALPANDGGLSAGQAVVAAARVLDRAMAGEG